MICMSKNLIDRIVEDEKEHLKIFKELYNSADKNVLEKSFTSL